MQERFMVRTVEIEGFRRTVRNTLADSRPDAVRQVERITIDKDDRGTIRAFLEGMDQAEKALYVFSNRSRGASASYATIFWID